MCKKYGRLYANTVPFYIGNLSIHGYQYWWGCWNQSPAILRGKYMGKQWKQCQTLFLGAPKSLQMVIAAMKLKHAYSLEGKL